MDDEHPQFNVIPLLPTLKMRGVISNSNESLFKDKTDLKDQMLVRKTLTFLLYTITIYVFQTLFLQIIPQKGKVLQQELLTALRKNGNEPIADKIENLRDEIVNEYAFLQE